MAERSIIAVGQRFRCRYLHRHDWQRFSTDDGRRYVACAVCRKERAWDTPQVGGWVA